MNTLRWHDGLAWLILGSFTALWCARWPLFPVVLDPAYHLLIAQQVAAAGGPILYETWEAAPLGRPHLYPPIFHLLLAACLKLGWHPVAVIRLASVALPPALLLSVFLVARWLFTPSVALACAGIGVLPWAFHLHGAMAMAAWLGLIELLWLVVALERERTIAAGLLFAMLCYTHLGLPWIALASIGVCALLRPSLRATVARASWALIVVLPWWWHLWRHRALVHPVPRFENALWELTPLIALAALLGLWRGWREGGRWLWPAALGMGMLLLLPRYLYRWVAGEGMLPVILSAGVGLDWLARAVGRRWWTWALLTVLALGPTLTVEQGRARWRWTDSTPFHLLRVPDAATGRRLEAGVHGSKMEQLAEEVQRLTKPGEILWSNASYAGGWIAALTSRALSSLMLDEIPSLPSDDPIRSAHLIVWFKTPPLPGATTFEDLNRYPLKRVGETELALLFRNPTAAAPARPPRAVLPLGIALLALGAGLVLIIRDLR